MPRMHRSSPWALAFSVLALAPSAAFADTSLTLPTSTANRTIVGDVIVVSEAVAGDLVVTGRIVRILADVEGDLLVAGGEIDVQGDIAGDARIAGWNVALRGRVGGEAMVSAGKFVFGPQGSIGADLRVTAMESTLEGVVEKESYVDVARLTLDGKMNGNANVKTGELILLDGARINGNLQYAAPVPDPTALDPFVKGTATLVQGEDAEHPVGALTDFSFISLAMSVAFALFLLWLMPALPIALLEELRGHPLRSAGYGVLGILAVFPILILVFSGVGTQIGMLLLGAWGFLLSSMFAFTALALSALVLGLMRTPTNFWMYASALLLVFTLLQLGLLLLPVLLLAFILVGIVVFGAALSVLPKLIRVVPPPATPTHVQHPPTAIA